MLDYELISAMEQLEEDKLITTAQALISKGVEKYEIWNMLNIGIKKVGDRYENGEYFIADLIVSGVMYRSALSLLNVAQKDETESPAGKVVIGVMKGDYHDIGKDIVIDILRSEKFTVIDLGVDVRVEQFVQAVLDNKPDVLLLSGVMKFVHDSMEETIRQISKAGLREGLAILVGGNCVDDKLHLRINADQSAKDPLDTLDFCKKVIEGKKNGS